MGKIFREKLTSVKSPMIVAVRGKGLLNAVVIKPHNGKVSHICICFEYLFTLVSSYLKTAWDVCMVLRDRGILAKPTRDDTIRFTPPLVITEAEMRQAVDIIIKTIADFH